MNRLLQWIDLFFLGAPLAPPAPPLMPNGSTIAPVMGKDGCHGHMMQTCRGYRAVDNDGRDLGYYRTPAEAIEAIANKQPLKKPKPKPSKR